MTFTKAEFPFYSTCKDFSTRILITLCLGCDVYEGRFKRIGTSYLQAHVKSVNSPNAGFDKMLKDYIDKKVKTRTQVTQIYFDCPYFDLSNGIKLNEHSYVEEYEYLQ